MDLGLPKSARVVLVGRGDDFIAPRGGTAPENGEITAKVKVILAVVNL